MLSLLACCGLVFFKNAQFRQQAEEIAAHTDVLSLPWLPLAQRQDLPNVSGIYFVLENERVRQMQAHHDRDDDA